ncbi:MBL fold metallo-hydrolase [Puniceibacterium sediminis]|uniref:Glyoxylase, beta-lactamase superfamily II n=1 Tax=Puniceibacterium sediminis TaxID=1608407 RepID=A0A238X2N8_9RHOB|nr:MBL fold metallo-hydrolase [Puniceibacterium sediminis]SNR52684.1 Glyoxylase, beta-lactamase superfamily II [Puniceibacterium sediminis]
MSDPDPSFAPPVGTAEDLSDGLRRLLAPNPSPMTFRGTNTYLLGTRGIAVIDPGPQDERHLDAILAALRPGQEISHIVVTHAHLDHSPLSRRLSEVTGAPVLAFGNALAGRSTIMQELAASGLVGGGEGVDAGFEPDIALPDGAVIEGDGWHLDVVHTPGHFGNHIALGWGDALFCGDLVMGWATSLVSPPDGDLSDFMASARRLQSGPWRQFHPGHGAPLIQPQERLAWLINHRLSREASILAELDSGPAGAADLARRIYTDTPAALIPAATRNVLAHLVDLTSKSVVTPVDALTADALFSRLRG